MVQKTFPGGLAFPRAAQKCDELPAAIAPYPIGDQHLRTVASARPPPPALPRWVPPQRRPKHHAQHLETMLHGRFAGFGLIKAQRRKQRNRQCQGFRSHRADDYTAIPPAFQAPARPSTDRAAARLINPPLVARAPMHRGVPRTRATSLSPRPIRGLCWLLWHRHFCLCFMHGMHQPSTRAMGSPVAYRQATICSSAMPA